MKAIALLGSPRKEGNTDLLATEVLRACREQGCQVEKIYLDDLNIRPIGPMVDDFKQRRDDRADDDWPATAAKLMAADIVIWASPVYWQGVTAQMKCFVDRLSTRYVDRQLLDALANCWMPFAAKYGLPLLRIRCPARAAGCWSRFACGPSTSRSRCLWNWMSRCAAGARSRICPTSCSEPMTWDAQPSRRRAHREAKTRGAYCGPQAATHTIAARLGAVQGR